MSASACCTQQGGALLPRPQLDCPSSVSLLEGAGMVSLRTGVEPLEVESSASSELDSEPKSWSTCRGSRAARHFASRSLHSVGPQA